MKKLENLKFNLEADICDDEALEKAACNDKSYENCINDLIKDESYENCINDLIKNENVNLMRNFQQHCRHSCFDHCLYVSYTAYKVCKALHLDYKSAARGALLHDMFLYDWRKTQLPEGRHAFVHADIAFRNANQVFTLNKREKDIITKHMWPVTLSLPRYKESYLVGFIDKYCTFREIQNYYCSFIKFDYKGEKVNE